MKKFAMSLCALALCLVSCRSNAEPAAAEEESPASAPPAVKKGDIATVPVQGVRVEVVNPEPVGKGKEQKLSFGQECPVQYGGKVKVIAVDGDQLLVEYAQAPKPMLLECPNGTIFFMIAEDFSLLDEEYSIMEKRRKEKLEHVKELLKQK